MHLSKWKDCVSKLKVSAQCKTIKLIYKTEKEERGEGSQKEAERKPEREREGEKGAERRRGKKIGQKERDRDRDRESSLYAGMTCCP